MPYIEPLFSPTHLSAGPAYAVRATSFVAFLVIVTFLFYAPWVYGLPLTNDGHDRRRWLPRWN